MAALYIVYSFWAGAGLREFFFSRPSRNTVERRVASVCQPTLLLYLCAMTAIYLWRSSGGGGSGSGGQGGGHRPWWQEQQQQQQPAKGRKRTGGVGYAPDRFSLSLRPGACVRAAIIIDKGERCFFCFSSSFSLKFVFCFVFSSRDDERIKQIRERVELRICGQGSITPLADGLYNNNICNKIWLIWNCCCCCSYFKYILT